MNELLKNVTEIATTPSEWPHVSRLLRHPVKTYESLGSLIHTPTRVDLKRLDFPEIKHNDKGTVLFAEIHASQQYTPYHGLLAHALNFRGYDSVFLFGGKDLELDEENGFTYDPKPELGRELSNIMNLPSIWTDATLDSTTQLSSEVEERLDRYAECTLIYQLQKTTIDESDPVQEAQLEQYREIGRRTWNAVERFDEESGFDYLVSSAATYLPRAAAIEYAQNHGQLITGFSDPVHGPTGDAYFVTRMDGINPHYIPQKAWEQIKAKPLSPSQERELEEFLSDRFEDTKQLKYSSDQKSIGIGSETDIYSLYTHLPWESAIRDVDRVFANQYEWAVETIRQLNDIQDAHLFVKIHPAEVITGTNESALEEIEARLETIPNNVTILRPKSEVSPYTLINESDVVLTYTSTVGMEATYMDTPVVTAANAHYAGKGFTYDPKSQAEYDDFIKMPSQELGLDAKQRKIARRYMYNYFINRPINDGIVNSKPQKFRSFLNNFRDLDDLKPGKNEELDALCTSITSNSNYYYTKEV